MIILILIDMINVINTWSYLVFIKNKLLDFMLFWFFLGGTLLAAKLCREQGLACSTGGGTHHAFPEYGSGFCLINDLAVTAQNLLDTGIVSKVLIVDLDVHQVFLVWYLAD